MLTRRSTSVLPLARVHRHLAFCIILLAFITNIPSKVQAQDGVFTVIDFPGTSSSTPYGINDAGDIVGSYDILDDTGNPRTHGYKLSGGIFTTIDPPDSLRTYALDINGAGDVVGEYNLLGDTYGYKLSAGIFTTIAPPGAVMTKAFGINDAGDVVGIYSPGNEMYGFKLSGGALTKIAPPGAVITYAIGINNVGDIVGTYYTVDGQGLLISHGFKLSGGAFTTIDIPGATHTHARGVNDVGDVIGTYVDSAGKSHGYKLSGGGAFTTIDVPGSTSTSAFGVNNAGDVVGFGNFHGFKLTAAPGKPIITAVKRQYPGVFLEGATFTNRFDVSVDWKGKQPGTVKFSVNGKAPVVESATSTGASHSFKITNDSTSDFSPSYSPSVITITAINKDGKTSPTWSETLQLYPYPAWLQTEIINDPSLFKFTVGAGVITYGFQGDLPNPHWARDSDPQIVFPDWVPYLGGRFGLTETFLHFGGAGSSLGAWSFNAKGQTGFTAMGQSVKGEATGSATIEMNSTTPLKLRDGKFSLKLSGTVEKEVGLVDALPGSAILSLAGNKFIGPLLNGINKAARLKGELGPSVTFNADWGQDSSGNLTFTPTTAQLGFGLKGTLEVKPTTRLSVKAWAAGSGNIEVGTTAGDFVKKAQGGLQVGAEFNLDYFFKVSTNVTTNWAWRWDPATGLVVRTDNPPPSPLQGVSNDSVAKENSSGSAPGEGGKLSLIEPNYQKFGDYSAFDSTGPAAGQITREARAPGPAPSAAVQQTTLITNVFKGASPSLVSTGGGKLLLWAHQRTTLPVTQSTDVAWSYNDGSGWSSPAFISQDTQAEISPAAARDTKGKIVAVWARIKEPNFSTPITTTDDLPLFYKKLEVVSSVFDPVTRLWGPVTQLTDDTAFDTEIHLSSDKSGNLLLSWLSNPTGEFMSTSSSPSALKYSRWDGAKWSTPANVDTGLVGVSSFAAAGGGSKAYLVVPRDPNVESTVDGLLRLYKWDGATWGAPTTFAAGGVYDNRLPSAVYDVAGEGHVVWVRGNNLVHATLTNPTPSAVRPGSASLAFYGSQLLTNPQGNLTLLRHEAVNNGPSGIVAQIYDTKSKTWSADRQIQSDQRLSTSVTGYYGTDGLLRLAYLSTAVVRKSQSVVIDGQAVTMTNIPADGATDLRLLDYSLTNDLAVVDSDLTLTPALPTAGQSVTAKLDVKNSGDFTANNFQVNLYAGSPDLGGVVIGTARVSTPLVAGDHRVVSIPFINRTGGDLFAVADDFGEFAEANEANNRAKVRLPLLNYTVGGKVSVGATGVGGVTMTILSTTPSGFTPRTVTTSGAGTYSFANLPAGRSYTVTPANINYTFSPASLSFANLAANQPAANFSATPKSYNVSGKVSLAGSTTGLSQVAVTISSTTAGFTPVTVLSNSLGAYTFTGVPAGRSYVIKPDKANYTFAPASISLASLSGSKTGQNFAATLKTYSIGGAVKFGTGGLGGVTLTLSSTTAGFTPRTVVSAATSGAYSFANVPAGRSYVVTPAASNVYSFTPASKSYANLSASQTAQTFTAARKLYAISGKVMKTGTTTGVGSVTMTLKNSAGAMVKTVTTLADGTYSVTGVPAGVSYVLRPTKTGMTFTPNSKSYTNLSANQAAQNFTGT